MQVVRLLFPLYSLYRFFRKSTATFQILFCGFSLLFFGELFTPTLSAATTQKQNTEKTITKKKSKRPNIIYIMADDMGWGDVSYSMKLSPNAAIPIYPGSKRIRTPHLEKMAAAGMTFNRFYAASPVCSTTRAAFFTGRQHERIGIYQANTGHMRNGELTLAEIAQTQGYATGHFGKWHLGTLTRTQFEFDGARGGYHAEKNNAVKNNGANNKNARKKALSKNRAASFPNHSTPWDNGYNTALTFEKSTNTYDPYKYENMKNGNDNFPRFWFDREKAIFRKTDAGYKKQYPNIAPNAPHPDPRANGDTSKIFMDAAIQFIKKSQANDQPFFITVWFATPHGPITHKGKTPNKQYDNAIEEMDDQIGQLRKLLKKLQLMENTLLVFTSDNGPTASQGARGSAGGLKGRKGSLWEGGIRVPGIVEWNNVIPAGSETNVVAGVIDLMPTLLDILKLKMPDNRPLDGQSLKPIWEGAKKRHASMKYWYRNQSILTTANGKYKLKGNSLYDLINDPKETTDVKNKHLATFNAMKTEWETWKKTVLKSNAGKDYAPRVQVKNGATLYAKPDTPWNFKSGARKNDTPELFVERQYTTLQQKLNVDSTGNKGTYNTAGNKIIPKGTVVHSYLLHSDPTKNGGNKTITLTFKDKIIGVIADGKKLANSDINLSFANPFFGNTNNQRSTLDPKENWSIAANNKTITITLNAKTNDYDQLRIITKSNLQLK